MPDLIELDDCRLGRHYECAVCSVCTCHDQNRLPEIWPGASAPQTAMRGATHTPTAY